jgi:hypothetical protein
MVILPALAMLTVLPPVLDSPPLKIPSNFNAFQVLIVLPFYLGLLAAPGYLHAWSGIPDPHGLSPGRRVWLLSSLVAATVASVSGAAISIPILVPVPFAVASGVCAILLLVRLLRAFRVAPAA